MSNATAFAFTSQSIANSQDEIRPVNSDAIPHVSATIKILQKHLTPGQQLSLVVTLNYLEGTEIFFEPSQYNWQPFTLLEYSQSPASLVRKQGELQDNNLTWKTNYSIELTAPIAGTYKLPDLSIHSYLGQQHQFITIVPPTINVESSFNSKKSLPKLQGIETVDALEEASFDKKLLTNLILVLVFVAVLIVFTMQKNKQLKKRKNQKYSITNIANSPQKLIDNALNNDICDWQALRHSMIEHLGVDPLAEQINIQNLALSNDYISARFGESNKQHFIKICELCLLKLVDSKGTENA